MVLRKAIHQILSFLLQLYMASMYAEELQVHYYVGQCAQYYIYTQENLTGQLFKVTDLCRNMQIVKKSRDSCR